MLTSTPAKPGFFAGIGCFLRGFRLINTAGLRRFVVIPLGINIVLFVLAIWFGISWVDAQIERLDIFITENTAAVMPWLANLAEWLKWILIPLATLVMLAILFYSFGLLANLIAAPFNGLLAQRVEDHLAGNHPDRDDSMPGIIGDIGAAFLSEFRKLFYFSVRAIPLLVLFIIPGVNIAAGLLWFLFSAWMSAIEYSDYPMGNHRVRFPDQKQTLKGNKPFALGFGTAAMTATMIPILNFTAMPVAVAGATAMWTGYWKDNMDAAD